MQNGSIEYLPPNVSFSTRHGLETASALPSPGVSAKVRISVGERLRRRALALVQNCLFGLCIMVTKCLLHSIGSTYVNPIRPSGRSLEGYSSFDQAQIGERRPSYAGSIASFSTIARTTPLTRHIYLATRHMCASFRAFLVPSSVAPKNPAG